MAMSAIGLNTDLVKLVKSGGKPILLGFCCWTAVEKKGSQNSHRLLLRHRLKHFYTPTLKKVFKSPSRILNQSIAKPWCEVLVYEIILSPASKMFFEISTRYVFMLYLQIMLFLDTIYWLW